MMMKAAEADECESISADEGSPAAFDKTYTPKKLIARPMLKKASLLDDDSSDPLDSLRSLTKMSDEMSVRMHPDVTVNMFWTGGFDSTAQLLRHVRRGHAVRPYYMRHSPSSGKCKNEEAAKARIIERLGKNATILESVVWDYEQLRSTPHGMQLSKTLDELADAVLISHQYSALRFCRDVTGQKTEDHFDRRSDIELCVVQHDELWERMLDASPESPLKKFFRGFSFPLINESKRDLWNAASEEDREILRLTYCCENPTRVGQSCIAVGTEFALRCGPCKRRFEGLE